MLLVAVHQGKRDELPSHPSSNGCTAAILEPASVDSSKTSHQSTAPSQRRPSHPTLPPPTLLLQHLHHHHLGCMM